MSDRALLEQIYKYWLEFRSNTTPDHRFAFCNHLDDLMYEYDRTRMAEIRDCSNCGKNNKRNCTLCAPHYSTLPYWIPKEEKKDGI